MTNYTHIVSNCPPFDILVNALEREGYKVRVSFEGEHRTSNSYRFASVTGNKIRAGFCTPNDGYSYRYIDGRIAADHEDCFDKWSKCPLIMNLPNTEEEAAEIIKHLEWLRTPEGFEWSNAYGYFNEAKVPRVID